MPPRLAAAGLLLALVPAARGGEAGPPKECRPLLDVRHLVRLELEGRLVSSPRDLASHPAGWARDTAALILSRLCDPSGPGLQRLAQYLASPITVRISPQCGSPSQYESVSRVVTLVDYPTCAYDTPSALAHEVMHAVFVDHAEADDTILDYLSLCFTEPHDGSIFDPDDGTALLYTAADTHPARALDEGVAEAVSLALEPKGHRGALAQRRFRLETGSASWRRTAWARKQRNEHFVTAVMAGYLGERRADVLRRLPLLVRALRRRPRSLEALLDGLAEEDPVEARGRLDAVLRGLNAGWDSETAEVSRLRR